MKALAADELMKPMAYRAQVASLIDQRRKLVESERKRFLEAQKILTAEQARPLVAELVFVHPAARQRPAGAGRDQCRLRAARG